MKRLRERLAQPVTWVVIGQVLFWGLFSWLSLTQFYSLKNQMNDLGNLIQPLWYTTQGKLLYMTNTVHDPTLEGMTRLAGHANWMFLLLVPLYSLGSVPLLLVVYVGVVSCGALGLYLLAKDLGVSVRLATLPAIAYLVSPQLHDAVLYDLHASTLALPLVIWAILLWRRRIWKLAVPVMIMAALCKEDMALVMAGLGWLDLVAKRYKIGVLIGLGFGLYALLMVGWLMPALEPQSQQSLIESRYAPADGDWIGVIGRLGQFDVVIALLAVLVSTGGLAFRADWWWSLSSVHVGINFLSQNPITRAAYGYYYQAPLVVIGLLVMAKSLTPTPPKWRLWLALGLILGHSFSLSPAPYSLVSSWESWKVPKEAISTRQTLVSLPNNLSVSVQNNVGPYLAERNSIISFPHRSDSADLIVLSIFDPYPQLQVWPRQRNFVFLVQMQAKDYQEAVLAALSNPDYGVRLWTEDGLLVLEKGLDHSTSQAIFEQVEERLSLVLASYLVRE